VPAARLVCVCASSKFAPCVCLADELKDEDCRLPPQVCEPVAIPMAHGAMESLNVGVAGSILMFMLSSGGGVDQVTRRLAWLGLKDRPLV
jgi:hypothetical protein